MAARNLTIAQTYSNVGGRITLECHLQSDDSLLVIFALDTASAKYERMSFVSAPRPVRWRQICGREDAEIQSWLRNAVGHNVCDGRTFA